MTRLVELEAAIAALARGELVAFPTETVYGLGADASQPDAVARIFRVKGRPTSHPLIVHLAGVEALTSWARELPPFARRLADVLMPGPLTLVLPRADHVSPVVTGGLDSVGLRVPAHPLARALIEGLGRSRGDAAAGVAAPSANRFGAVSPTRAAHVLADLEGEDVLVLDGGDAEVGLESTIVDCASPSGPSILRVGGTPRELLEDVLGAPVPLASAGPARAPGMLASHYAPKARVLAALRGDFAREVRAALATGKRVATLGPEVGFGAAIEVRAERADATLARSLYATLRELDEEGVELVVVALPEPEGLGLAIADRLTRAAHRG